MGDDAQPTARSRARAATVFFICISPYFVFELWVSGAVTVIARSLSGFVFTGEWRANSAGALPLGRTRSKL
jgi:hypothetical protein